MIRWEMRVYLQDAEYGGSYRYIQDCNLARSEARLEEALYRSSQVKVVKVIQLGTVETDIVMTVDDICDDFSYAHISLCIHMPQSCSSSLQPTCPTLDPRSPPSPALTYRIPTSSLSRTSP
jgi:hypothetical protein